MKPFSVYLHIPFCLHKCPYCDFNTYATAKLPEEDYTAALLAELDFRAAEEQWRGRTVQTIFFGGGTPSLFKPRTIKKIINAIGSRFPVDGRVEVSLEANPGTLTTDSLSGFRAAGVNRLSLGVQTFNPTGLRQLGRVHTAAEAELAVSSARTAGFSNLSIDLIFGWPLQTVADLSSDLINATNLGPDHISAYALTLEKGTEFYSMYKKGKLRLPTDDTTAEMLEQICEYFPQNGFSRYEISNFAKPGREARHNMAYWNGDDYLGLGAGAHSFYLENNIKGVRWSSAALPKDYMELASSKGSAVAWRDELGELDLIFEVFFLGLRKTSGVDLIKFEDRFGVDLAALFPGQIEVLKEAGLIRLNGSVMSLTHQGFMLSDSVVSQFICDKKNLELARRSFDEQRAVNC